MKKIRFLACVFGIASIVICMVVLWIVYAFGDNIYFEQILWHLLESPIDDFDKNYIQRGLKYILFTAFFCSVWTFILYSKRISLISRNNKYITVLFVLSVGCFLGLNIFIDRRFHVYEYLSADNTRGSDSATDELKENYFIPERKDIVFSRKESIVLLLVESMETSYNDPLLKQRLMPNMEKRKSESKYADKYTTVYGTGWTVASITGWFFGLPLKMPNGIDGNRYLSKKGFLPGAESIFDILGENGYELVLVMGSSSRFSGIDILFSGHGRFVIRDKNYFLQQGWSLEEHGGTGWGFSDGFVLARAWEEYQKLRAAGKPFVLFVETLDTHSPGGFCPPERRTYNDIRDAIVELDRNLEAFSRKIWNDDVIYVVLGDHFFMGNPDFMKALKTRYIFNLFHGDLPPIPEKKRAEYISALDMAPTLLQAAGARWGNDQFGLGISLFSARPSLLEHYGPQRFNELLGRWSPFYSTLYEKKTHE